MRYGEWKSRKYFEDSNLLPAQTKEAEECASLLFPKQSILY